MKYAIFTALCAAIALLALRALALRCNWLDQPDDRKAHTHAVPAVGGLSWMLALLLGAGVAGLLTAEPFLFGAIALLCLLGAIDDRYPLPSILRLLVQSLAVVLAFWQSPPLASLGDLVIPGSVVHLGVMSWPMTVFACVGVINAVNMIDGMDGLLGLILLATFSVLLTLFHQSGHAQIALTVGLSIAALIPFLFLNVRTPWLHSAAVFFGDAGSMSAGLFLAWLLVTGSQAPLHVFAPVSALYWLAVPLVDTVALMARRVMRGVSPFKPDQEHLHHLLQRAGFGISQSLALIVSAVVAAQLCGVAMHLLKVPAPVQAGIFVAAALSYHVWILRALQHRRWLGRPLSQTLAGRPS
jgi:UDP-GlcNAc:undecaprenyl-phosphate/decaprenyl-phosphate GlcNAc-1-phosphate transferase